MSSGSGGSWLEGGLGVRTITVSAAQLCNLREQPVILLGAPGVGFGFVVLAVFASLRFGTELFVSPNEQAAAAVAYVGATQPAGSGTPTTDDFSFFLCTPQVPNGTNPLVPGSAVQISANGPVSIPNGLCARSQIENCQLALTNSGSEDFSTGDSELVLTILFFTVPL
jgi:hypothetical protein